MRKLLVLLCLLVNPVWAVNTFEFKFESTAQGQVIMADTKRMVEVGGSNDWMLNIHWEPSDINEHIYRMHSVTEFAHTRHYHEGDIRVDRIYNFGLVDCRLNQLFLLREYWALGPDNVITGSRTFRMGELTVDLVTTEVLMRMVMLICDSKPI